jgi:hypothetical protein
VETARNRVNPLASARSILEACFGILTFAALVYVVGVRFSRSEGAEEYLYWVDYFVVRALLSCLMVYAGIKSYRRDPSSLFSLHMGIALASVFVGVMNVLERTIAGGDYKDLLAAVIYLPLGLVVLWITLYIRARRGKSENGPAP